MYPLCSSAPKNSRWCEALHDSLRYYMLLSPSWDLGTGWTWGEFPKVYHSQACFQLGIYVIWLFFCFEYGFAEIKKVISGTLFVLLVYLFCRRRRRKSRSMQNVSLNLTSCNGRWGVFFSSLGPFVPTCSFFEASSVIMKQAFSGTSSRIWRSQKSRSVWIVHWISMLSWSSLT